LRSTLAASTVLGASLLGAACVPGTPVAEASPSQEEVPMARSGPEPEGVKDELGPAMIGPEALDELYSSVVERMPEGFHATIEAPFVVVGDVGPGKVRSWAQGTVRWAVAQLRTQYFSEDLAEPVEVWLFRNRGSYERHVPQLFGERPHTPYGYYSPRHRALIMNIGTGGGTLVHEIVHPFMASNFPECPAWFNEGMGSLYEESEERDGVITGRTNWRLPSLQNAIRDGRTVPLREVLAMDRAAFYGPGSPLHYAEVRYLCYWLQEQGVLQRFYRSFRAAAHADPTGVDSLRAILDELDIEGGLDGFQRTWEAYCLELE